MTDQAKGTTQQRFTVYICPRCWEQVPEDGREQRGASPPPRQHAPGHRCPKSRNGPKGQTFFVPGVPVEAERVSEHQEQLAKVEDRVIAALEDGCDQCEEWKERSEYVDTQLGNAAVDITRLERENERLKAGVREEAERLRCKASSKRREDKSVLANRLQALLTDSEDQAGKEVGTGAGARAYSAKEHAASVDSSLDQGGDADANRPEQSVLPETEDGSTDVAGPAVKGGGGPDLPSRLCEIAESIEASPEGVIETAREDAALLRQLAATAHQPSHVEGEARTDNAANALSVADQFQPDIQGPTCNYLQQDLKGVIEELEGRADQADRLYDAAKTSTSKGHAVGLSGAYRIAAQLLRDLAPQSDSGANRA